MCYTNNAAALNPSQGIRLSWGRGVAPPRPLFLSYTITARAALVAGIITQCPMAAIERVPNSEIAGPNGGSQYSSSLYPTPY